LSKCRSLCKRFIASSPDHRSGGFFTPEEIVPDLLAFYWRIYFMNHIKISVGPSTWEWDADQSDQNHRVALGKLISAMYGSTTVVNGLACTPIPAAGMSVNIASGEIYQMAPLEATTGDTNDTGYTIMKQGISLDSVTVPNANTGVTAFVAPELAGQSINYLIEAAYADADVSIAQEPGCTDANSNIFRNGVVALQIKTGTAAMTGTQVTPEADSGYVGLWVVTLDYGQTVIDTTDITTYAGAPILPTSLLASIQSGNLQYGIDMSATANVIQGSFPFVPTALTDNQQFWVRIRNSNTGAVTFTPNAGVIDAAPVVGAAQLALQGGECVVNGRALLVWRADIASYVLEHCTGGTLQVAAGIASQHAATLAQVQSGLSSYAIDAGTANTYVVTLSPALTAYADGIKIRFRALTANTGASTLNVNGLGAVTLVGGAHAALAGGEIVAGGYCEAEYNGALAKFVLLECTGAALQVAKAATSQHAAQFSQLTGVVGSMRNAQMSIATAIAKGTFTADEIIVTTALGGLQYRLGNFSQDINLATTGAGGMDTGTAPTSGYVALYAIYNPTERTSAILATNATSAVVGNVYGGANMPSGYTASALVSVWPTNASHQLVIGYQADREIAIVRTLILTTAAVNASLIKLPISGFVPPNAKDVWGDGATNSGSTTIAAAISFASSSTSVGLISSIGFGQSQIPYRIKLLSQQAMYYSNNSSVLSTSIYASGYSF
jgi:hypothetical protein